MKEYFIGNNKDGSLHLYEMLNVNNLPNFGETLIYTANGLWDENSYLPVFFHNLKENGTCTFVIEGHSFTHSTTLESLIRDRGAVDRTLFTYKQFLDEDEYQRRIAPPHPKEILDIVELMKKFGDFWKDDCGEVHLDDVQIYPCATEILNYFKPKEDVKEEIKDEIKPENSAAAETLESFEQIVKKRKEKNQFSLPKERRHGYDLFA